MKLLESLRANLIALGVRKLVTIGVVLVSIVAVVLVGTYLLGRPSTETLYTGLDEQDISRVTSTLREYGYSFDVSSDGKTVLVAAGTAPRARMLLAERGLPKSAESGYELFDKLGALGLTSFMQDVTRLRALEGELARTIQQLDSIKAARVHIVMPDSNVLQRQTRAPSAAVIVKLSANATAPAEAIRQLVASAVPALKASQVTVLSTDGAVLAAGGDDQSVAASDLVGLERNLSNEIHNKISATLVPYLGIENFRASVSSKLNTDKRQLNETVFDPDSKVERSVRVVRESGAARENGKEWQTSVEQNIPDETAKAATQKGSSQENQRREEVTNYDVNSKTTIIEGNGYTVESLSVAVVVNRSRLAQLLGEGATDDNIKEKSAQIETLVAAAAGLVSKRGDSIKVIAVEFQEPSMLEAEPSGGLAAFLADRAGLIISSVTIIIVTLLFILLAIRPMTRQRALDAPKLINPTRDEAGPIAIQDILEKAPALPIGYATPGAMAVASNWSTSGAALDLIEDVRQAPAEVARRRLQQLVEFDEERAVGVLKSWIKGTSAT